MKKNMDGNTAAASIAYKVAEMASIYPITPSSTMAELCDEWASNGVKNIYDKTMTVLEMQSEAGAVGAMHGALLGGALATTFTASQGLLLMIPNMYKIAGELLPCVIHVAARTLATHALSIFGDHSDVMACRSTGFAMLCASSVQECMDFSLLAHSSTLLSRVPFMHFFDGFRTSHEIQKIDTIEDDIIKQMISAKAIEEFKAQALNPNKPRQFGTAQNPDVFFQNREACQQYYDKVANIVQEEMDKLACLTGRSYKLFDYYGASDATDVIVMMGSGCGTVEEVIDDLNAKGQKIGLIKVRLFRPFNTKALISALPKTAKHICVLDRVKDSAAIGEPLYQDVVTTLKENNINVDVICGRYGLGGKDFTPKMVKAIVDNMQLASPKSHFTVGINDDVTHSSLELSDYRVKTKIKEYKFFGLGSDGTVSANKNSIKIIGDKTDSYVQGYFEYDSKKSGSLTISHLKTSDEPIRGSYLLQNPDLIACHQYSFINKYDILKGIDDNGTFILNCPYNAEEINDKLPNKVKKTIKDKNITFYIIDAEKITNEAGLGHKINTVMQSAFFYVSKVIPVEVALEAQKEAVRKSYARKGEAVLNANYTAIDNAISGLVKIDNATLTLGEDIKVEVKEKSEYFNNVIKPIIDLKGNELPVSTFTVDGSVPTATSKYEKRCIATTAPCWISENCIQCNMCAMSCPHAIIRPILADEKDLEDAPEGFIVKEATGANGMKYRIQINPKDCTGCGVCANVCPSKNKALVMKPIDEVLEMENENYDYSLKLPYKNAFPKNTIKGSQFEQPLFEFSGACAGCGETPYVKLLTQLFGKEMIIANATGCSSIYGGSCPTCPYSTNKDGQGPAWANSLFEDNAEFGLGIAKANRLNGKEDSIWILGGDGWAYDIGYGGLDHVLASGENINILVLDTEVYSNTGGQSSKSTPLGATAKFAAAGKRTGKKPLAQIAMCYNNVYVAQISMGANMQQTIKALTEAHDYKGVSLIIAYCPCINHGIDMSKSSQYMKDAVQSGYFQLFRFNPDSEQPLTIDSKFNTDKYVDFLLSQNRYKQLKSSGEDLANDLYEASKQDAQARSNNLNNFIKKED